VVFPIYISIFFRFTSLKNDCFAQRRGVRKEKGRHDRFNYLPAFLRKACQAVRLRRNRIPIQGKIQSFTDYLPFPAIIAQDLDLSSENRCEATGNRV
jgi:hypothetical protein